MWIEFKNYQENAVVDLKTTINKLLDADSEKVCIFKSPTGSGKTLMMAETLKRLIDSRADGKKLSFVWIAVNKLHDQSRNNLKKYYNHYGIGIKCSYFADLDNRQIGENEILFLNWASINKKGNVYVRANERNNNLSEVIARTKDEGRTIVLVIDESHHTASSTKSKELIYDIGPKVTVEISATPQLNNANRIVEVDLRDVRDEGMIKKEIVINPGFKEYIIDRKKNDKTADELVLESALKKRIELKKKLEAESSTINPLLLIQLPDARSGVQDKKEYVMSLLKKYGYSTDNGKLAVYLTGSEKINLDNIEKNENEVEVMLFKQAIALGWDCPRASVLVLFRQWREENMTFSIQTLGRIMRMPEQKHYTDQDLNVGYVFTSLEDIRVAKDISKDYITVYEGYRSDNYKDIDLVSYHSKRFREETRLSSDFTAAFFDATEELNLKGKISLKHIVVDTKLMANGKVVDVDKETANIEKAGTLDIPKNEVELQNAFDMFVRDNLDPFAPEMRSIKRVNDSIYRFFDKEFKMGVDEWPKIQAIVLAKENKQVVIDVINRAKELYQDIVGKGKNELIQNEEPWNVPKIINYNLSFIRKDYRKSVIRPYYAKIARTQNLSIFEEDSSFELAFIEYLENASQVKWWFKNGKQDASYFAVPYRENDIDKPFYVDFVVMLRSGKVGLFDTKGGIYAQAAKDRAEGLARYIEIENKKGKNIFGGIVIKEKNSWRYNDSKSYIYNIDELNNWKFLDLN